ncbi:hypothetical protein C8Q78DRAFT_196597 [Trametes maxima]|nr:hypothetical protein C8Q78DRAFT_196597 [Trametes maxima]
MLRTPETRTNRRHPEIPCSEGEEAQCCWVWASDCQIELDVGAGAEAWMESGAPRGDGVGAKCAVRGDVLSGQGSARTVLGGLGGHMRWGDVGEVIVSRDAAGMGEREDGHVAVGSLRRLIWMMGHDQECAHAGEEGPEGCVSACVRVL